MNRKTNLALLVALLLLNPAPTAAQLATTAVHDGAVQVGDRRFDVACPLPAEEVRIPLALALAAPVEERIVERDAARHHRALVVPSVPRGELATARLEAGNQLPDLASGHVVDGDLDVGLNPNVHDLEPWYRSRSNSQTFVTPPGGFFVGRVRFTATSFAGEWGVDSAMARAPRKGRRAIIVGIPVRLQLQRLLQVKGQKAEGQRGPGHDLTFDF